MIEGLIFVGSDGLWNCLIPLIGVVKLGVNIEDNPAEWVNAVADNLADTEFSVSDHRLSVYGIEVPSAKCSLNKCGQGQIAVNLPQ